MKVMLFVLILIFITVKLSHADDSDFYVECSEDPVMSELSTSSCMDNCQGETNEDESQNLEELVDDTGGESCSNCE